MAKPTTDWKARKQIASEAASLIDSSWHSSWHWDYDRDGYLTHKGWEQALADAESRLSGLVKHAERLRNWIGKANIVVEENRAVDAEQRELEAEDAAKAAK